MANTDSNSSSSTILAPGQLSSSISLPPCVRRIQSNKIKNLNEYTNIPESAQIDETSLPLLNPYTIFKKDRSLARKINFLVQHRSLSVKEYIQSIALDNCLVPATAAEQYVDL
ncbi:hypothetical protein Ddye_013572 [Dipteronia dyeriana]|uniref:Uncharacterized protein n=1 Tax=Dipteronia dyeriana TaxID=168575 RepID=A0AAD9X6C8_9ROSI|nr:hypothetical protein Ddye_013572 [Dipteronia dyeriana]